MIQQYITYQHNVQRYFREHSEKYYGVIIPLSISTSFPTGTYGFVRALCAKFSHKTYAIDPRTPLFQRNWNRDSVRAPHEKMAAVLGVPFVDKGLVSHLEPQDIADSAVVESVTRNCLEFQHSFRTRQEDVRKLRKYQRLLDLSDLAELEDPQFLIPPYFMFGSVGDEWYNTNLACVLAAQATEDAVPIQPIIHFSGWPVERGCDQLAADMERCRIAACWLYPDSCKEHEVDAGDLIKYRRLAERLSRVNVRPQILFGGYFAVLLSYYGLTGFANGIGYGEWRSSAYHRGGNAANRIYVPRLHRYLDPPGCTTHN